MSRTDRYILSQLLILFGFFSLVLVAVYWINRAVWLFDTLIGSGHSTLVFLEFTTLSLPSIIVLALPLSTFAACVYVLNRLISDSEMVVLQTTGFSPWRLARPFFQFGVIVAVMMSLLTHFLVPASMKQLSDRQREIAQSITAKLLTDGTFLHPAPGITFYIREITPEGILSDVFLSDNREGGSSTTFTAAEAYLVYAEGGSKLVMVDGMAQTLSTDGRLALTSFKDFTYDVGSLVGTDAQPRPFAAHMSTADLLLRPEVVAENTGASPGAIAELAHARIAQALFCLVVTLFTCSSMLQGSFSRFGPWRYVVVSLVILIGIKVLESTFAGTIRGNASLWPLAYAPSGLGLLAYLVQQSRNAGWLSLSRRDRVEVAA